MLNFTNDKEEIQTTFKTGGYKVPVTLIKEGNRLFIRFGYNKKIIEEIKCMEGAKWHGFDENKPRKMWSVALSPRNMFQLLYLTGHNPYAEYEKPLIEFTPKNNLYKHQYLLAQTWITFKQVLWAAEMGTGKSLSVIEVLEYVWENYHLYKVLWVAPKSALASVSLELRKWKISDAINVKLFTYDDVTRVTDKSDLYLNLDVDIVVFDESSRVKNPTAKRSQGCMKIANYVRGRNGYICVMTGSPAPKNPGDWWWQCEIACPGFLKEGTFQAFKKRLSIVEMRDSITGGVYPHLVTWKDDESKCDQCGKLKEDHTLDVMAKDYHPWKPGTNEISKLYKRMSGLVTVVLKKDCLDLPDKIYKIVDCKPSKETLRAASLITDTGASAIKILIGLRELSDGFQYKRLPTGRLITCDQCGGYGECEQMVYVGPEDDPVRRDNPQEGDYEKLVQVCDKCNGNKKVEEVEVQTIEVACPKDDALIELLEDHEDVGRLVVYGGFTATIDRIVRLCSQNKWRTIRVDGRGVASGYTTNSLEENLRIFQDTKVYKDPTVFIGHPGAAGMGVTLTASPTIVYYSNDFNAESRIQSEDRIHRIGMDVNKGATIIDLIHLDSDLVVLENLKKKRDLQSITMGTLNQAMIDISKLRLKREFR